MSRLGGALDAFQSVRRHPSSAFNGDQQSPQKSPACIRPALIRRLQSESPSTIMTTSGWLRFTSTQPGIRGLPQRRTLLDAAAGTMPLVRVVVRHTSHLRFGLAEDAQELNAMNRALEALAVHGTLSTAKAIVVFCATRKHRGFGLCDLSPRRGGGPDSGALAAAGLQLHAGVVRRHLGAIGSFSACKAHRMSNPAGTSWKRMRLPILEYLRTTVFR